MLPLAAAVGAIAAHVLAIAAVAALPRLWAAPPPPASPPAEAQIVMVQQDTPSVGGTNAPRQPIQDKAPPHAEQPAGAQVLSSDKATETVNAGQQDADATAKPPTPQDDQGTAKAKRTQPAAEAAEVNLGLDAPAGTGIVTGAGIIPARPDDRHINRPPAYPRGAAMRGETGEVVLYISIAPDGTAERVDLVQSSGHADLDSAARRAVQAWRFKPGMKDGKAVPSSFTQVVDFQGAR